MIIIKINKINQTNSLQISMSAKHKQSNLWRDSPCTMPFVTRNMAIDRTPRFSLFSIYHKDDVHKSKKIFNEFQKPELLLKNFQRQIQDASFIKKYKIKRISEQPNTQIQSPSKLSNPQLAMAATSRLYEVPQKFQYKHDAYGNRSNLIGQYNAKQIAQSQLEKKKNFSCGRRVDLSRPLNFYPGPGAYFKQKTEKDSTSCRNQTCINFRVKRNSLTTSLNEKQMKNSKNVVQYQQSQHRHRQRRYFAEN